MEKGDYSCHSTCFKCNRGIVVEFYENEFETEENTTFLGRLGTTTFSYCPYCGVKELGFIPYDWNQKRDFSLEDDPAVPEDEEDGGEACDDDDGEAWWPDAEGVTLIDEDEGNEEDPWDETEKVAFTCPSCGKKTLLNPKGCDRIFCYFCGKETERT